jgi:hypothetical protein
LSTSVFSRSIEVILAYGTTSGQGGTEQRRWDVGVCITTP